MKTAVAIRHIHFENLGTFESVLIEEGYQIEYYDIGTSGLSSLNPARPDLLVVLGGPIGVYEEAAYPFLIEERRILKERIKANLPTIGICLGAQLMASAFGAEVYFSGSKEIGFSQIQLTKSGAASPLRHLANVPVLHWHGDTFHLPNQAQLLASTPICQNQAFAVGHNLLGLQFHPEVDADAGMEPWLVGHAVELSAANISPTTLRQDAKRYSSVLRDAAQRMLREWLHGHSLCSQRSSANP